MKTPLVSIILFAHAPFAKFLPVSLGSILSQSYTSLQVIVLGDGSEEVKEVVHAFREDGRLDHRAQGSLPFLQAANELMEECEGAYIGTWNSDDIYNRDHVKILVEALERDPGAGAAFDNMEYFRDGERDQGLALGLIISEDRAKKLALSRVTLKQIFVDNFMTGPSSLIRKSVVKQIGGYEKNTFLNCDLHWFYRIAAYFPLRFVNYVGVRKRLHPLNNTAVNPHYEYGVKELEDIRDHYPDVYRRIGGRTFNKKLGRKYFRLGLYYDRCGEKTRATEAYKRAMFLRKFSFHYHWSYVRSLM